MSNSPNREWVSAVMLLCAASFHFLDLCRASWDFTTDDAFITLRYAQHWADGHGVVWNIHGPTVEGYSNFLFVALAAAAIHLGLTAATVLKLTACTAAGATAWLLYLVARRYARPLVAALPGVVYLLFPGTAWWAVSGLETSLHVFLAVAALAAFGTGVRCEHGALRIRPAALVLAGAVVALGGMVRPEAPVLGAAFVFSIALSTSGSTPSRGRWRKVGAATAWLALGFVPVFAPYLSWKLLHFGHLVPNSIACKASAPGSPWTLILDYAPIALLTAVPLVWVRRSWADPTLVACLLLNLAYVIALYGADTTIGYGIRHFLAAFALLTIPAAAGLGERLARTRDGRPAIVVLGLHLLCFGASVVADVDHHLGRYASDYAVRTQRRVDVAQWLRANLRPRGSFLMGDVGIAGFVNEDFALVDAYCINNAAMGRAPEGEERAALLAEVQASSPQALVITSKTADVLQPRSVFNVLLEDPTVSSRYRLVAKFGEGADRFNYWLFLRNDLEPETEGRAVGSGTAVAVSPASAPPSS